MSHHKIKSFWVGACFFILLFLFLLAIHLDVPDRLFSDHSSVRSMHSISTSNTAGISKRDTWMNIFQNDKKIGYAHSVFSKQEFGCILKETVFMQINTMGKAQALHIQTQGKLYNDFSLSSFEFEFNSGVFNFSAKGTVTDNILRVKTTSAGADRIMDIHLQKRPYLMSGILNTIRMSDIQPGKEYIYEIFDPATMGQEPVKINIMNIEDVRIMGKVIKATKISMDFKGAKQLAWVDENGDLLKEEGLLGITLIKTTPEDARSNMKFQTSDDLVEIVSIAANVPLNEIDTLSKLKLEISGADVNKLYLNGGRQILNGNILTIQKESVHDLPTSLALKNLTENEMKFLNPTPFVQSDHKKIKGLVNKIVSHSDTPLEKTRKLLFWIHKNIEKKPVLSLPNALSTLENRIGDCNEHAALMAAFARAGGIPSKIEAGLVYLNGRFYYHAWNLLYVGKWITADSLFGQIPADVSHIRLSSGDLKEQLNLMSALGNVKIKIKSFSK